MEESKEQTYEMLRRVAGDSSAVEPFDRLTIKLGCDIAYSYSGQSVVLRALADRIEAEQRAIAEAQGKGVHHIMKAYAEKAGMPMEDGESITEWLDRWFVPRPRFEDGEAVPFGGEFEADNGSTQKLEQLHCFASGGYVLNRKGKRASITPGEFVKRPSKVLDADGVEIKIGDTVYEGDGTEPLKVVHIFKNGDIEAHSDVGLCSKLDSTNYTHERPVPDADGVPIREGDTVYVAEEYRGRCDHAGHDEEDRSFGLAGYEFGQPITVLAMEDGDGYSQVYLKGVNFNCPSFALTHRPPDSLEKLRDDMRAELEESPDACFMNSEYVDRLAALIERGA